MGLFNGARHLSAQLDSLVAQDYSAWRLVAGDDGSTDGSPDLLRDHARHWPTLAVQSLAQGQPRPDQHTQRLTLSPGPRKGFAANYLALLAGLPDDPGWLALADQDDVWLPDRLSRGISALRHQPGPALHCGAVWITDEELGNRRHSGAPPRQTGFGNALVQNVASGNTMLANPAAARVLVAGAKLSQDSTALSPVVPPHVSPNPVAHDWWAYQLVTGAGGTLLYDPQPMLLYRQHDNNRIGANTGLAAMLARLIRLGSGTRRGWTDSNLAALSRAAPLLTDEARAMLEEFAALRQDPSPLRRLQRLQRLGLYRQRRTGTLALWCAGFAGRL